MGWPKTAHRIYGRPYLTFGFILCSLVFATQFELVAQEFSLPYPSQGTSQSLPKVESSGNSRPVTNRTPTNNSGKDLRSQFESASWHVDSVGQSKASAAMSTPPQYVAGQSTLVSTSDQVTQASYVQRKIDPNAEPGATATSQSRPIAPPSKNESSKNGAGSGSSLVSMGINLLLVLGLFLGAAWVFKKSGLSKTSGVVPNEVVQVVGRKAISGRQQLMVVKFGSKVLLVNNHQGEARTLSETSEPAEVQKILKACKSDESTRTAAGASRAESFSLNNLLRGKAA